MNSMAKLIPLVAAGLALTACSDPYNGVYIPRAVERGYVSQQARSALPVNQDLGKVVRGVEDRCYYILMEGTARGYLSPVLDPYHHATPVCDPITTSQ